MKPAVRILALLSVSLIFTGFYLVENIVEKLGIGEQNARRLILNNLVGRQQHDEINTAFVEDGSASTLALSNQLKEFSLPRVKTAVALASGERGPAAVALCSFIKEYVTSPSFLEEYGKARERAKPTGEPPVMDASTMAGIKSNLKELETTLAQLKSNKQIPPAMLKQVEEGIAQQKNIIAANGDPTPNKTAWLRHYPENPSVLIKARLEEYLKLAATVDFSAKLVDDRGKKKFANPAYESKPLKWKAIYRAGKEVNEEVSAFAKSWLKEPALAGVK